MKTHRLEKGTYFQMPKSVTEMGLGMAAGWLYTGLAGHANNQTGIALVGIGVADGFITILKLTGGVANLPRCAYG